MSGYSSSRLFVLVNDLSTDELHAVHCTSSDILVSISPRIPTQFYLLPSIQESTEHQTESQKSSLVALGEKFSIPQSQQIILESQFWRTNLLALAIKHNINTILVPKKWSSLKYLGWWFKRKGIEVDLVLEKTDGFFVFNK